MFFLTPIHYHLAFRLDDTGLKTKVVIQRVVLSYKPIPRLDEDENGDYIVSFIDYKNSDYTFYVTLENGERYMALLWNASFDEVKRHISSFFKKGAALDLISHPLDGQETRYYRNFPRFFFKDPKTGEVSVIFIRV